MRVFLSYPSEEREVAERIHYSLKAHGYDGFFDRADLPRGRDYDKAVAAALGESSLFIFLITPASVKPGRYTLTEVGLAERKWPNPSGWVLPIMLRATDIASIPAFLRAVTILEPRGDVVAETAFEAQRLVESRSFASRGRRALRSKAAIAGIAAAVFLGSIALWRAWPFGTDKAIGTTLSSVGSSDATFSALPAAIGRRARSVTSFADGFVLATASPSQLLHFSSTGERAGIRSTSLASRSRSCERQTRSSLLAVRPMP